MRPVTLLGRRFDNGSISWARPSTAQSSAAKYTASNIFNGVECELQQRQSSSVFTMSPLAGAHEHGHLLIVWPVRVLHGLNVQ